MRIAFSLSQSLDSPSGLGRHGPLARELARQGHAVEIYALHPDWHQMSPRVYFESNIRIAYVGQMHVQKIGARKEYFGPGQLLTHSMMSTLRLARAIYQSQAQVLQLCKPQPINALATRMGRRGRPILCDCDDYEAESNRFSGEWQRRVVRHFEDSVVDYAAGLTVNTRFSQDRYRNLGFPEDRILYVPNGVDRARFTNHHDPTMLAQRWDLDTSDPTIAYIGTLSTLSHSVDLLLQAFSYVLRDLPTARLLLVGGGEDYDSLRDQAMALGISSRTLFVGRVSPMEVPKWLALATVSVDPVRDNVIARARSPLKIVESIVMGVPVVTGDVGDRRSMLANGELGILTNPGDSKALAEGLLILLKNRQKRTRIAQAALASVETWYWDNLVGGFAEVYDLLN